MFDSGSVTTAELEAFVSRLAAIDRDVDDADRVDQIAALERVKGAAAAAQARVSVDFDASQREVQAAEGVPARKRGAGVGPRSPSRDGTPQCAGAVSSAWLGPW